MKKWGIVRGCSTLRDPICCLFFISVPFLKDSMFLISSGKQERAELHAGLRTEIMGKNTCLDSLQWLSSVAFYLQDYPFFCNWWNFINGWVIILLKIYKNAFLQIKYPCFTWDLRPPHPSFLHLLFIDSCPQVLVCQEHHNRCISKSSLFARFGPLSFSVLFLPHSPV